MHSRASMRSYSRSSHADERTTQRLRLFSQPLPPPLLLLLLPPRLRSRGEPYRLDSPLGGRADVTFRARPPLSTQRVLYVDRYCLPAVEAPASELCYLSLTPFPVPVSVSVCAWQTASPTINKAVMDRRLRPQHSILARTTRLLSASAVV